MKKQLFYIFLIVFNSSIFSQTQRADLIFIDGDTIQGLALITRNHKIKFKLSHDDKAEKWDFRIVKGVTFYGFEEVREFEYIKVDNKRKPLLLEVKHRGKVSIYEDRFLVYNSLLGTNNLRGSLPYENKVTYLKRADEVSAKNLFGFNFRKNAKAFFRDCPEIIEIFNSNEYRKYTLQEIALEYNVFCSE
ncbi:hypothetical protein [Tenacibaculum amylolyticum]|uniref:hypothetical protein n=1 Tax=Tenacibaculum amylolyticum TaxID=104269 RepID=UPI003894704A